MSVELKIKSKHLSEEARIIRFEERKLARQVQYDKKQHYSAGSNDPFITSPAHSTMLNIKQHRRWDVRNENRATFLARAFLSGKTYASIEAKRNNDYTFWAFIVPRVLEMVNKYGPNDQRIYKQFNKTISKYEYNAGEYAKLKDKVKEWIKQPI